VGRLLLFLATGGVCAAAIVATGAGARSSAFSCNGTFNNQTFADVDVPASAVCRMSNDTVTGTITVEGQLFASTLDVGGDLLSDGGKVVQIDSSTIDGNLKVKNLHGAPADQDAVSIVINTIHGFLGVSFNKGGTGDFLVSSNTVDLTENVSFNTIAGDLAVAAETVTQKMKVNSNTGAGTKEVDGNTSSTLITCTSNAPPFESHGNSAPTVSGQCH